MSQTIESSLSALQSALMELVRAEAEATRRSYQTLWDRTVSARIDRGRCIDRLVFSSLKEGRFLHFHCAAGNTSDFREGDLVRLSRSEPAFSILSGALYRVEDDMVWFEPDGAWEPFRSEIESGEWVLDASYLDLESLFRDAVRALGETVRGRERILPLLTGDLLPCVDLDQFDRAAAATEKEGGNEAQKEAIAQGVATDLCYLIQGPPGTGKTFVLAQIVKHRLDRGERILVTSSTHRAIHNALNTITRVAPEISDIAKIGWEIHDPDLRVRQYETFSLSPLTTCDGGYVVGATPFALRSKRLRGVEFDAVIVDEASQVTLPLAVMAMLSADCYVFIGDHRQLPPVVQSLGYQEALLASVFGRLSHRGFSTMLEITYRLNDELCAWPSQSFYDGKLRPAADIGDRRLALPTPPSNFRDVLDPANPLVLVELEHRAARRVCNEEAILAADLLVQLKRSGLSLGQVAVVVPFRRQARRIRSFLRTRENIQPADLTDCAIDTVERMQGQERDVIIVSMTASRPEYVETMLSFLLQPQRLNVSVTRARTKVIILASKQIAATETLDPNAIELLDLWRSLREACHVIVM